MGNILEAIASDRLCVDPDIYKGNSKLRKARKRYCNLGEKLMSKLNEEEKSLLEDYNTAQIEENVLYGNDRFIKGFRLGVLMMMETVGDEDSLILHEED